MIVLVFKVLFCFIPPSDIDPICRRLVFLSVSDKTPWRKDCFMLVKQTQPLYEWNPNRLFGVMAEISADLRVYWCHISGVMGLGRRGRSHMCHSLFSFCGGECLGGAGMTFEFILETPAQKKPTNYKLGSFLKDLSSSFFPVMSHSFTGIKTRNKRWKNPKCLLLPTQTAREWLSSREEGCCVKPLDQRQCFFLLTADLTHCFPVLLQHCEISPG